MATTAAQTFNAKETFETNIKPQLFFHNHTLFGCNFKFSSQAMVQNFCLLTQVKLKTLSLTPANIIFKRAHQFHDFIRYALDDRFSL